jgi:ZIP family zinc transporter
MEHQTILIAFIMTLIAGLSTGIGSLIALIAKHTNTNFLSFSLGLSAGVMIYVSFMEMLPTSLQTLTADFGEKTARCTPCWLCSAVSPLSPSSTF